MHILMIEDDLDLGRALLQALRIEGITAEWLRRAADAPRSLGTRTVDCVLLDLSLPDGAGLDLLSRIHAVVRRSTRQAGAVRTFGDLQIEPKRHEARLHGELLELSPREFRLLLELGRNAGTVISKGTLSRRLELLGDAVEFAAIEVHISNLRRKIGAQRIRTVRGVGYLLVT